MQWVCQHKYCHVMSSNLISFDFLPNCCLDKLLCPLYFRTLPARRRKRRCSAQCAQQFAPTLWPVSRFWAACVHTMQKVEIYKPYVCFSWNNSFFACCKQVMLHGVLLLKNNHKTKNPARWCCQWHQFFSRLRLRANTKGWRILAIQHFCLKCQPRSLWMEQLT